MTKGKQVLQKLKEMGCTLSSDSQFAEEQNKELWTIVDNMEQAKFDMKKYKQHHSDWVTIRLFVSCTFKDFRNERNAMHHRIYEAMKNYCEQRKLIFVLEDFHTGRNEPLADPEFMYLSMDALEQGYGDNYVPYFIGFMGECTGLVPAMDWLDEESVRYFKIPRGLSLHETEIAIATMKTNRNPNSLLLARNDGFLNAIPFHQVQFIEESHGRKRAQFCKQKLWHSLPVTQFNSYNVTAEGINDPHRQFVQFSNESMAALAKRTIEHLKKRIHEQYTLDVRPKQTQWQRFMEENKRVVIRANKVQGDYVTHAVDKIHDSLSSDAGLNRICVHGDNGTGRSTILAHLILRLLPKGNTECAIKNGKKGKPYKVFFHFTMQTIDGRCTERLFQRLLFEIYAIPPEYVPEDLDQLRTTTLAHLTNPKGPPVILIIDDIDMLDDQASIGWLQHQLQPHVRVVISYNKDSNVPKMLKSVEKHVDYIKTQPLARFDIKHIINKWMRYVPRDTVVGCKPLQQISHESERPTSGKRQTADALADLVPLEMRRPSKPPKPTLKKQQSQADAEIAKNLWAGLGAKTLENAEKERDVESDAAAAEKVAAKRLRNVQYTPVKCMIMATMLRHGVSLDRVKALAYFGPHAVCDSELQELESDANGHLKLGLLCLLATARNGLREVELRHLMAKESKLLPSQIKRHNRLVGTVGVSFKFTDHWSLNGQVSPLRWRQTVTRLRHHLIEIGQPGEHRLIIGSGMLLKAIHKRYISKPAVERHFRMKLLQLYDQEINNVIRDRYTEEMPTLAIALEDKDRFVKCLTTLDALDTYYHPVYSGRLLKWWNQMMGRNLEPMSTPYIELVFKLIEHVGEQWEPHQLLSKTERVASLFLQAKLYNAASRTLNKAIEIETGMMDQARNDVLGRLHFYQGEIGHHQIKQSNELFEWVAWDDLNRIPYLIASYDSAVEKMDKVNDPSDSIKLYSALCKLRSAFWHQQQELHVSTNSQVQLEGSRMDLKSSHASTNSATESTDGRNSASNRRPYRTAAKLAKEAQEAFSAMKRPLQQAEAQLVRAQCETKTEKILDNIQKAREILRKDISPNHPLMLRVCALGLKMLKDCKQDEIDFYREACAVNDILYAHTNKQKHAKIREQLDELKPKDSEHVKHHKNNDEKKTKDDDKEKSEKEQEKDSKHHKSDKKEKRKKIKKQTSNVEDQEATVVNESLDAEDENEHDVHELNVHDLGK